MMRDAVKEFNDREIIPYEDRFEKKTMHSERYMKKAVISVSWNCGQREYGGLGMGFVSTMLVVKIFLVVQVLLALLLNFLWNWNHANYLM